MRQGSAVSQVAIVQHTPISAPGAIANILSELGRQVRVIRVDLGEPLPQDASGLSGLICLGGSMSAHAPLPWIAKELALIRDADRRGVPVAGHCLGSQLVALALGGTVRPHVQPEIGWSELYPVPGRTAQEWLGAHAMSEIETFQWHYDTFEPPQGAELLAISKVCRNQVVVLKDMHLLVQSHLEVTLDIIERMVKSAGHSDIPGDSSVHAQEGIALRTERMHRVLSRLYARWAQPFR